MGERLREGDKLPFFRYDTPYSAQNRLRDLLRQKSPLFLVFMSNFGHPVTRTFAGRYASTAHKLKGAGLALVVRSRADKLSASIGPDSLPFPLLCDADGVLYDRFAIPQRRGTLLTYSLEGWRILSAAKRQGYRPPKDTPEQLPLTLILDGDGTILFCHYGASLTDVPTDCAAMQSILEELELDHPVPPALHAASGSLSRRVGLERSIPGQAPTTPLSPPAQQGHTAHTDIDPRFRNAARSAMQNAGTDYDFMPPGNTPTATPNALDAPADSDYAAPEEEDFHSVTSLFTNF